MTDERVVLSAIKAYARPVKLDQLAQLLRLPRRVIEESVQALRLAGEPLLSSADGIEYSRDPVAVAACAERLRQRARTQMLTAMRLKRTAQRLNALTLWDAAA